MRLFSLFCLLVFLSVFPLHAQTELNSSVDVFPSKTEVQTGSEIDIAIRQNIRDGWHTYWVNPGDSGEAMTIDWDMPDNVSISKIYEPTPDRIDYDPLINFGHAGQPVFVQTLSVDDKFEESNIILNGKVYLLVCDEICIPETHNISLTIPIGSDATPINRAVFNKIEATHPTPVDWESKLSRQDNQIVLTVDVPDSLHNQMTDVEIYPYEWGIAETTSIPMADIGDDTVTFTQNIGHRDWSEVVELINTDFLIKTSNNAYIVTSDVASIATGGESQNIALILIFAFVGGVILNLMPCVFPVLSMKAMSLIKLSSNERKHAQASGIAYTIGVVGSFLAIATILIILKSAGEGIGWGFQLQNPYIVATLATLLFVIGLNLVGVFEIKGRFASFGSRYAQGNDVKASFFTGVLATLVATPCSAPFMASAIGYALTQNAFIALVIFAFVGLGLAFPYLLLTFIPAVQKILPKPGAWMETFRQLLAFPMFASAIWLLWVLTQQTGSLAILYLLGLFLSIIFIIWLFRIIKSSVVKALLLAFFVTMFVMYSSILMPKEKADFEIYSAIKLEETLKNNPDKDVFVNMTAAWCITCLVNERTSLSAQSVKDAFKDNNVVYMKGDWTNQDPEITKYLEQFGRNGVPLYVHYKKSVDDEERPEPKILPQILTPKIIINAIENGD